jgi:hypothetical protein
METEAAAALAILKLIEARPERLSLRLSLATLMSADTTA